MNTRVPLSEQQELRVVELLGAYLKEVRLVAPGNREAENVWSRRHLVPAVQSFIQGLKRKDLIVMGPGAAPMVPARLLGLDFVPDLAVSAHSQMIVAIELKFLRGTQRQYALATALGQSLLYRQRFRQSLAFLVDWRYDPTRPEHPFLGDIVGGHGVHLVLRPREAEHLGPALV